MKELILDLDSLTIPVDNPGVACAAFLLTKRFFEVVSELLRHVARPATFAVTFAKPSRPRYAIGSGNAGDLHY